METWRIGERRHQECKVDPAGGARARVDDDLAECPLAIDAEAHEVLREVGSGDGGRVGRCACGVESPGNDREVDAGLVREHREVVVVDKEGEHVGDVARPLVVECVEGADALAKRVVDDEIDGAVGGGVGAARKGEAGEAVDEVTHRGRRRLPSCGHAGCDARKHVVHETQIPCASESTRA